jgi:hypothetical protein
MINDSYLKLRQAIYFAKSNMYSASTASPHAIVPHSHAADVAPLR